MARQSDSSHSTPPCCAFCLPHPFYDTTQDLTSFYRVKAIQTHTLPELQSLLTQRRCGLRDRRITLRHPFRSRSFGPRMKTRVHKTGEGIPWETKAPRVKTRERSKRPYKLPKTRRREKTSSPFPPLAGYPRSKSHVPEHSRPDVILHPYSYNRLFPGNDPS